jgi:hypothetical protein
MKIVEYSRTVRKNEIKPEEILQCQFCFVIFNAKYSLNSHINSVHNGIRYKCTGCGILRHRINDCRAHIKICKLLNIYAQMEKIKLGDFKEATTEKIYRI